jgi:hypothetical protein
MEQIEPLEITNPNRAWVVAELEQLHFEWLAWQREVEKIVDQPYDRRTQSEVFADGEAMMRRHDVLQAKTLTFLNNNVRGHGFIRGFDGRGIDRTDLRLRVRVTHRLHQLDMLQASLQYAKVPESFWKQKAKELLDSVAKKTGDAAIDVAASYLKNPLGGK